MQPPELWPNDADGDVLRKLAERGLDFGKEYSVDFNVDFTSWPPHPDALTWITTTYPTAVVVPPDEGGLGYVQFKLKSRLSYEFVVNAQSRATAALAKCDGVCESWGILLPQA
jgi:hypothetical protein